MGPPRGSSRLQPSGMPGRRAVRVEGARARPQRLDHATLDRRTASGTNVSSRSGTEVVSVAPPANRQAVRHARPLLVLHRTRRQRATVDHATLVGALLRADRDCEFGLSPAQTSRATPSALVRRVRTSSCAGFWADHHPRSAVPDLIAWPPGASADSPRPTDRDFARTDRATGRRLRTAELPRRRVGAQALRGVSRRGRGTVMRRRIDARCGTRSPRGPRAAECTRSGAHRGRLVR